MVSPGMFLKQCREGDKTCADCGLRSEERRLKWLKLSDEKHGILPAAEWKYYCDPCRVMQVLGGETNEMFDLEGL